MEKEKIYQIKITLRDTEPEIWRRVLVHGNITFYGLHHVIQIAMGWENSHLFEFCDKKTRIGYSEYDEDNEVLEATEHTLAEYFKGRRLKFIYEYDFGDGWLHDLKIEKVFDADPELFYPVCTAGERACPPEDVGGIHNFYRMLDILAAKRHPEKKEYKEWLGGGFDPLYFNLEKVNLLLQEFEEGHEDEDDDE